jgi:hypothetical protein
VGYKPELTDASIYTLRRRIPARPTDVQEEQLDQEGMLKGRTSAGAQSRLLPVPTRWSPGCSRPYDWATKDTGNRKEVR